MSRFLNALALFALAVVAAVAMDRAPAYAACSSIPFTFTNGVSTLDATTTNANNNHFQSCSTTVDNSQIGVLGIYASQVIPTSLVQATFGGAFNYTFPSAIITGANNTWNFYQSNTTSCTDYSEIGNSNALNVSGVVGSGFIFGCHNAQMVTIDTAGDIGAKTLQSSTLTTSMPLCQTTNGAIVNCNHISVSISLGGGCTGNSSLCFNTSNAIANHGQCWGAWNTTSGVGLATLGFLMLTVVATDTGHVQVMLFNPENSSTGGITSNVNVYCNP